jgi:hypothetical protein
MEAMMLLNGNGDQMKRAGALKGITMLLAHISKNFAAAFYPRLSEWVAAGVTLCGGWVLLKNPTLMDNAPKGYDLMLNFASQQTWASLFVAMGFIRLCILLVNGAIQKSPWLRAGAAFLSCAIWMQLVSSFAPVQGLGVCMALGYLSMDYLNIIRSMMDARVVDERGRRLKQGGNV